MQVVLVWLSAFIVMHAYYFNAVMSSERVLFALEVVRALGLEYINQLRHQTEEAVTCHFGHQNYAVYGC